MQSWPSNFCAAPLTRGFPRATAVSERRYLVGALSVQSRMTSYDCRTEEAFSDESASVTGITSTL